MKKQRKSLLLAGLLAVALFWSGTTVLMDANAGLLVLRGGENANECDCTSCEDNEDDPNIVNECWHTWAPPTPNAKPPVPDPNDPNKVYDDPNYAGCSDKYCIKNSFYYAACDVMAGGPACPMHEDINLPWAMQEVFDHAPAACRTPNYAEVHQQKDCTGLDVLTYCVVDSCGGEGATRLDPNIYYSLYRGYDPNDPNEQWGRIVCDD